MPSILSNKELIKQFGRFEYKEDPTRKGWIIIEPEWKLENLTSIGLPFGPAGLSRTFSVNKKVQTELLAIFTELEQKNLLPLVRVINGVWAARHIMHNLKRGLSRHSWGIAIDINAGFCPVGKRGHQPLSIVKVFESHGWAWGGRWHDPDEMHFEKGGGD